MTTLNYRTFEPGRDTSEEITTQKITTEKLKTSASELCDLYNEGFATEPWNDPEIGVKRFINRFEQLVKSDRGSFNTVLSGEVIIGGFIYGDLATNNNVCKEVIKFINELGIEDIQNDALWYDAFVAKDFRKKGICSEAFEKACEELQEQNKQRIWVTTRGGEEGKELQEFWRNRGMKMVSPQTGNISVSPADRVLLYKDL